MKLIKKPVVKVTVFTLIAVFLAGTFVTSKYFSKKGSFEHFWKDEDREEGEEKETGIDKEMSMWWWSRAYPDPTNMTQKYLDAWYYAQRKRADEGGTIQENDTRGGSGNVTPLATSGNWVSIGPNTGIGGRIISIAINPVKGNSVYIGSASGGIWKCDNAQGATPFWHPVVTGFPVLGVSSIIINPLDTMVIYAGTGEIYRIDTTLANSLNPSITGFNVWKTRGTYGVGILKSTNGGVSWAQSLIKSESNLFGIQRLRFDPTNPSTVYACATDGLYKSTDAGVTWTRILVKTLVTDVVINAKNNLQVVAAIGNLQNTDKGVYRSADGGSTWTKISSGLPASFQGFIKFDNVTSLGNRDTIIASIGVDETGTANELYRSTNFGTSWTALSNSTHTSYQFWCAHNLAINPFATDSLSFAGVNPYTFKVSTASQASASGGVHSDIHDIKYDAITRGYVYMACDGGMNRSIDGGKSFSVINSGLYAVQFYSTVGVGKSATSTALVVGGLQDNGVVRYNGSTGVWSGFSGLTGTDGSACFVDPNNDLNVLASGDAAAAYYSTNSGTGSTQRLGYWGEYADSRTAFVAPLAISKTKSGANTVMYVGTDNLHISTNSGTSFTGNFNPQVSPHTQVNAATNYIDSIHKTAIALAISLTDFNKLYVSTSPFAQHDNDADALYYSGIPNVLRSTTGTTTPSVFTKRNGTGSNVLPNRYTMHFAISPTNDDSVWVAMGGFGTSHVYVTADGGANWTSKDPGPASNGLPDVPANAIMIDPGNSNVIYVGTDLGVYVSPDKGITWKDFNFGFSDANLIMDLEPYPGSKILAATHGKGAFISPLYSSVLAVNLTSFTGYRVDNYDQLQWHVSTESDMLQYELERSTNGNSYTKIATVPAKNINNSSYSYKDYLADIQNATQVYYRLKMINSDGTFSYSNVVSIRLNLQSTFAVTGNPFSSQLTMIFTTLAQGPAEARLLDANGRVLADQKYALQAGNNTLAIQNLGSLAKGVYLLEFITPDQRYTRKVVKK